MYLLIPVPKNQVDAERRDAMKVSTDPGFYHKIYGSNTLRKPRTVYYKKDFIDYTVMMVLTALVIGMSYGFRHFMSITGYALCAFMVAAFAIRHGVEIIVPVLFRDPAELFWVWVYKLRNLRPVYFVALGLLVLENVVIRLTPGLPHHSEWIRQGAFYLFYLNVAGITVYRTISLIDHLIKREMVREILMQTPWRRSVKEKTTWSWRFFMPISPGSCRTLSCLAPGT